MDVLRLLLADASYVEGWHESYEPNGDVIEHPAHADGFKSLQTHLRAQFPHHKLVFVNIFLDEYEQHRMTKTTIYSIEMTLANVPLQVKWISLYSTDLILEQTQQAISRKYLLCSLPADVPLNEALRHVILPSVKLLELSPRTSL